MSVGNKPAARLHQAAEEEPGRSHRLAGLTLLASTWYCSIDIGKHTPDWQFLQFAGSLV